MTLKSRCCDGRVAVKTEGSSHYHICQNCGKPCNVRADGIYKTVSTKAKFAHYFGDVAMFEIDGSTVSLDEVVKRGFEPESYPTLEEWEAENAKN